MRNLYGHKFVLPKGTQVFVPTEQGYELGEAIAKKVGKQWRAPAFYYHMQSGGHIAAARQHVNHAHIASIDLARFFNQVTRTKVHRALCQIGFQHAEALEMARDSTVEEEPGSGRFSLPFGFVQSPILASVALSRSALGRAIRRAKSETVAVTVYVDDITISSNSRDHVVGALEAFDREAARSLFSFNPHKAQGPADEIRCFNLILGNGTMAVSDDRYREFVEAIQNGFPEQQEGILGYVASVNLAQHAALRAYV